MCHSTVTRALKHIGDTGYPLQDELIIQYLVDRCPMVAPGVSS